MKKSKVFNVKSFIINTLRRASYRWKPRGECQKNARISRGLYQCSKCKALVKNKQFVIDHIKPVIDIEHGFQTWDIFINNLFCDVSNFQLLCKPCSEAKTKVEVELRKYYRNLRKDLDK
jgi:hypothetical protein